MRFVTVIACLFAFVQAAAAEDVCMPMKDFFHQGGTLVEIKSSDPMQIVPPVILLDCGDKQCVANITVEGIVEKDGSLRDLQVTENTYTDKQDERAAALLQWKEKARYQPPMLNGQSVCVRQTWHYKFGTLDTL